MQIAAASMIAKAAKGIEAALERNRAPSFPESARFIDNIGAKFKAQKAKHRDRRAGSARESGGRGTSRGRRGTESGDGSRPSLRFGKVLAIVAVLVVGVLILASLLSGDKADDPTKNGAPAARNQAADAGKAERDAARAEAVEVERRRRVEGANRAAEEERRRQVAAEERQTKEREEEARRKAEEEKRRREMEQTKREFPYLDVLAAWLQDLFNGGNGLAYWKPESRHLLGSWPLAVTNYKILRTPKPTRLKPGGPLTAQVVVRLWSSTTRAVNRSYRTGLCQWPRGKQDGTLCTCPTIQGDSRS